MPAGCNLTSAPLHSVQVKHPKKYTEIHVCGAGISTFTLSIYNKLVYNEIMHRSVLLCGMTTVTCLVSTVCKVHRAVKARGVSECMLCMRLRNICDTGLMP